MTRARSVTFTPTDTTDYTTASSTVTVNVAQATPTVVSVNPVNITYGTALANGQLSGSASWTVNGSTVTVPGTFTYTSAAGTVLDAGNGQSEAVTFTPTDTTDYTTASSTVTVNVAQATPTVVSVNPVNITYGTALANGQLSGTASWTVNGSTVTVPGTFAYTSAAGTVLNAAANGQSEAVTFTPTDTTDYTHGLVDRDRQRRPGHADGGQRQPGQHHLRHGPGQRPAQRQRELDRQRQHRHGSGHLHLHQRRRNACWAPATARARRSPSRPPTRPTTRRPRRP